MWRTIPFVVSCLMLVAAALGRQTGFLDRTLRVGNEKFRYQVFIPAGWDGRSKWPVILFLHGAGERGDDGLLQTDVGLGHAIREHAERWPFLVVMPQCPRNRLWVDRDMQALALTALERAIEEFNGDPGRVLVSGMSMGGYGTWELAVSHPGKFAALVPICGGIRAPRHFPALHESLADDPRIADPYAETARRIGPTPVWIFHGAEDPLVLVDESRKMAEALRATGVDAKYTEYPGVGHDSWVSAYADPKLPEWMSKQRLPPPSPQQR